MASFSVSGYQNFNFFTASYGRGSDWGFTFVHFCVAHPRGRAAIWSEPPLDIVERTVRCHRKFRAAPVSRIGGGGELWNPSADGKRSLA